MEVQYRHHNIHTFFILVIFISPIFTLKCKRCSMEDCAKGIEKDEECRPEHKDCATSILRQPFGTLKANTVFEKYCYVASKRNKLYRRNVQHCQKNDKGQVEVCACQGDFCNAKLPPCRLRNYGHGQGCSRN